MHAASPTVAQLLFHGAACKVQPGLVEKREQLVWTRDPDHDGSHVGHVAEARFTFLQRTLNVLALGDIEADACHADRLAGVVEIHRTLSKQPVNAPVRPHHAEFSVPNVSVFEALPQEALHTLAVGWMNQSEPGLVRE